MTFSDSDRFITFKTEEAADHAVKVLANAENTATLLKRVARDIRAGKSGEELAKHFDMLAQCFESKNPAT